jgi:hypothetical protein
VGSANQKAIGKSSKSYSGSIKAGYFFAKKLVYQTVSQYQMADQKTIENKLKK